MAVIQPTSTKERPQVGWKRQRARKRVSGWSNSVNVRAAIMETSGKLPAHKGEVCWVAEAEQGDAALVTLRARFLELLHQACRMDRGVQL